MLVINFSAVVKLDFSHPIFFTFYYILSIPATYTQLFFLYRTTSVSVQSSYGQKTRICGENRAVRCNSKEEKYSVNTVLRLGSFAVMPYNLRAIQLALDRSLYGACW
uniref:Uncharacterized protein n=1 Tax=Cacopsylla melanoneura TaxID=428564 RepID=A0A8D9APY2_9HEMI